MNIKLKERTRETVSIYFNKARNPKIKAVLPQKAQSLKEALDDYEETLLPNAASYGETIWVDDVYVGDIWCYCIDKNEEPNAMISYCLFEEDYWSKGITTAAVSMFIKEILEKYKLDTIGAFTFASNTASIRVLEKNKFTVIEKFVEDGVESVYLQYTKENNLI